MSSTAIASALGGLTGSLGVSVLGLPHVFFAPALYGLIATVGIAVMSRSRFSRALARQSGSAASACLPGTPTAR